MKNKKILLIGIIVLVLLVGGISYFSSSNNTTSTNSINTQTSESVGYMDEDLETMSNEVADKFQIFTYEGMEYNLYIPENYDETREYPLVLFIPDSSLVGQSAKAQLTQGYGGMIWATSEEQEKHPSFVLVPVVTSTLTSDDWSTSDQIDTIVSIVKETENNYSIDKNRVYTTGQSMGCMASFYMNIKEPDLFAASLYVSGQWDTEALKAIEDDKFFYIVSAGDSKASQGLNEFKTLLDEDNVPYAYGENWDAQWSDEEFTPEIEKLTSQNKSINLGVLKEGTTLTNNGVNTMSGEHMTSFDYIYRIDAVRDWLFEQSK